jgi:hypothetical protein
MQCAYAVKYLTLLSDICALRVRTLTDQRW